MPIITFLRALRRTSLSQVPRRLDKPIQTNLLMIDESKLSLEGRASLAKIRESNRKQNENANRRPPLKESDWIGHASTKS